jgi:uncharacterized protein DUF3303
MLFMSTYTYEPGQRNEIVKRRLEKGTGAQEGLKIIGDWFYLGGHKGFMLIEASDPKAMLGMTMAWSDLMKFDTVPVMEIEEVLKLARSAK